MTRDERAAADFLYTVRIAYGDPLGRLPCVCKGEGCPEYCENPCEACYEDQAAIHEMENAAENAWLHHAERAGELESWFEEERAKALGIY